MFRARFVVYGSVQGVGYRSFVKRTAIMAKLNGYVKNMLDGTVEVVAEASTKKELEDFKNKLNKKAVGGFDEINVERIDGEITESENAEFSSFEVRL